MESTALYEPMAYEREMIPAFQWARLQLRGVLDDRGTMEEISRVALIFLDAAEMELQDRYGGERAFGSEMIPKSWSWLV